MGYASLLSIAGDKSTIWRLSDDTHKRHARMDMPNPSRRHKWCS